MARKLTYNELERTANELEKDLLAYKSATEDALKAKKELAGQQLAGRQIEMHPGKVNR